jgi:hypothetical protein
MTLVGSNDSFFENGRLDPTLLLVVKKKLFAKVFDYFDLS